MNIIERIMVEPFERFYEKLLVFLPNLITSLILLVIGVLLGIFVKWIFHRIFRTMNLDALSQKSGMRDALSRSGFREPLSLVLSRILKWLTIITFIIVAMQNLSIPTVEPDRQDVSYSQIFYCRPHFDSRIYPWQFLWKSSIIASVNAGMTSAGSDRKAVKATVFILHAPWRWSSLE